MATKTEVGILLVSRSLSVNVNNNYMEYHIITTMGIILRHVRLKMSFLPYHLKLLQKTEEKC